MYQDVRNKYLIAAMLLSFNVLASSPAWSEQVTLTVKIEGKGSVTQNQGTLRCVDDCAFSMEANQSLIFDAEAEAGWSFDQWTESSCDFGKGVIYQDNLHSLTRAAGGAKTIEFADFNGDGSTDFAIISLFNGAIEVKLNDGAVKNLTPISVASGLAYPAGMDAVDWDHDGDVDLLITEHKAGRVVLFKNDGNANFSDATIIFSHALKPYGISVGDVNQDGYPDLLLSLFNSNTSGDLLVLEKSITDAVIQWFINDGQGGFAVGNIVSQGAGAISLDSVDFDLDGDIDITAALLAEDQVMLYVNNGSSYQSKVVLSTDGPYGVTFGDLDNNGHVDILSASYWGASLVAHYQHEAGNITSELVKSMTGGATGTAIGDLDGDGLNDIGTSVFNDLKFSWLKNHSYRSCGIDNVADSMVTAIFKAQADSTPEPIPTPATPVVNESNAAGSGGGTFNGLLIFAIGLLLVKRRYVNE